MSLGFKRLNDIKRNAFLSSFEESVQLVDNMICNVHITSLFGLTIHIVHTVGLLVLQ